MYFGRFHYRVDLGQYFTPCEVIRLIVEIVNPRHDERIVDPACGMADFLVGAKQVASERHGSDISAHLHGYDIAPLAVHLSIFNMLLKGDRGLADIEARDTLLEPLDHEDFNLVEKVSWDLQSKHANRIFKRDPRDGANCSMPRGPARIPDTDLKPRGSMRSRRRQSMRFPGCRKASDARWARKGGVSWLPTLPRIRTCASIQNGGVANISGCGGRSAPLLTSKWDM